MGIGYECERTDGESTYMTVGIPGEFNVYNSLAAVTTCGIIGIPMEVMQDSQSDMKVRADSSRWRFRDTQGYSSIMPTMP